MKPCPIYSCVFQILKIFKGTYMLYISKTWVLGAVNVTLHNICPWLENMSACMWWWALNLAAFKLKRGCQGIYGFGSDSHAVRPWFVNPHDPLKKIYWLIYPSHWVTYWKWVNSESHKFCPTTSVALPLCAAPLCLKIHIKSLNVMSIARYILKSWYLSNCCNQK